MKLTDQTVLVTGGAGLIGSTIIDQLLSKYPEIRIKALDNFTRGTYENLDKALATNRVEVIREDIRRFDAIRPHFDSVAAVFHQAAIRITRCAQEPRECLEVLVDGTFNVLMACVEAKVERLVAASTASVYGMADTFPTSEDHHPYNNETWYGAAKVANEGMLRSFYHMHDLKYVALRYFNVYGPRMDVFGKYTEVLIRWLDLLDRDESPLIFGDGLQTMDFVFVGDVARANVLALESDVEDEVFNVGTGVETSLRELLDVLMRLTGKKDIEPKYMPERTVNSVRRRSADQTKAKEMLGFVAETPLEEGLRELIQWRQMRVAQQNQL